MHIVKPSRVPSRIIVAIAAFVGLLFLFAPAVRAEDTLTEQNKAVVRDFYTTVFIGRNIDAAPRFIRPDYLQHNATIPTGLKGLTDTFRPIFARTPPADYKRELLNVVGDKDIVVIYVRQTWTSADGQHHLALGFDMFRVQNGMITEHWDADV
jgi:predicted SnoaL-like aldol condensation-catalyzing enzyme